MKRCEDIKLHGQMRHAERMVDLLEHPKRYYDHTLPDVLPASITKEN